MTLVYASGRFFDSVRQDVRTTRLPEPYAIAGGVGSEIRFFPGGEDDPLWIECISQGWSEQVVRRVLADGNYDSTFLHRRLDGTGVLFYAPPINDDASPRAHHRRRVLARLYQCVAGELIENTREEIERQFALMGNVGCGLKELPNWVRRERRVSRWISAKLLLHHAYLIHRHQAV